jgi:nitrite reductase/ring-hydroxylating ferredoxin subunit
MLPIVNYYKFALIMRTLFIISIIFIFLGCEKNNVVNNNPYLPAYSFQLNINTSLPLYNDLQFPSNPKLITDQGAGIKGVIVMKVGTNDYRAYEASCPNQYPSDCSLLTIKGINAKCPCDDKEYSLFTGLGNGQYPLKPYRVEVSEPNIRIYN